VSAGAEFRLIVLIGVQIAAGLGLWFALPSSWQPPELQPPSPASLTAVRIALNQRPASAYRHQIERPLFVVGRRPIDTDGADSASTLPADFQLLGIYGSGAKDAGALVRAEGVVKRIPIGGRLGGMTLSTVEGLEAVFVRDGERRKIRLKPLPRAADRKDAVARRQRITAPSNPTDVSRANAGG